MKALHLLFLGIQESRTGEVCSHVDEVLRLGGGADKGHHGVELWINMAQPFAYTGKTAHFLQKQHVVVAYKDPRMILTNISHPMWRAWVVVGTCATEWHTRTGAPNMVGILECTVAGVCPR